MPDGLRRAEEVDRRGGGDEGAAMGPRHAPIGKLHRDRILPSREDARGAQNADELDEAEQAQHPRRAQQAQLQWCVGSSGERDGQMQMQVQM